VTDGGKEGWRKKGYNEWGRKTEEGQSGVKMRKDLCSAVLFTITHTHTPTQTHTHTGCNSLFNYM